MTDRFTQREYVVRFAGPQAERASDWFAALASGTRDPANRLRVHFDAFAEELFEYGRDLGAEFPKTDVRIYEAPRSE